MRVRTEQAMRGFSAATLADMEGETGINLAAEILANDPAAFDPKPRKGTSAPAGETAGEQEEGRRVDGGEDDRGDGGEDDAALTDRQRWERDTRRREAEEKVARFVAEAKRRAERRRAAAEERRHRGAEGADAAGDAAGGDGGGSPARTDAGGGAALAPGAVRADFRDPREFAAFLRVWAADRFARTHGLTSLGKAEKDRLFAEFYRICARRELNDLACKLLAPKGARAHVNRRLQDLEKGVRPSTVERISADVFAFINRNAIRESRAALVGKFRAELKRRYFPQGARFDALRQDADRRVTGWVEECARYVARVCALSKREVNGMPSQLQAERARLVGIVEGRRRVYGEAGVDAAEINAEDAETVRARAFLALLDKYGAMTTLMPGEIEDLRDAAFRDLDGHVARLEGLWKEARARQDRIRGDLAVAIVAPGGRCYQEGGGRSAGASSTP